MTVMMFVSEVGVGELIGTLALTRTSAVRDWASGLIGDAMASAIGSTWKRTALVSPGVQPALISPPGGAHTWLPSLSTTSEENTMPQSALVGSALPGAGPGTSTTAGPSASNPP